MRACIILEIVLSVPGTVFGFVFEDRCDSIEAETPAVAAVDPSIANLPIRTDIKQAITLGVNALTHSFDRDKDDEPYFYANRRADGTGEFHHALEIGAPHVVGRCLWATMLAEQTVGVRFPAEALAILTRYCQRSFANEDHLNSFIDPTKENQRFIIFHNMREGLLGLLALIKGRDSQWAKEEAPLMLRTLERITDRDGHLSMALAKQAGMALRCRGIGCDATTSGRLVGPLVEYYRCTKDPLALKLAGLYARATLKTAFTDDGNFAPLMTSGGHIHSITSTLSGITLFAAQTKNRDMLETCRRIVDASVPRYFSSWGWGDEVMPEHPANVVSRGEINQTGDVIRTALILGQTVSPDYYELAERFVRGMLLPTQHREKELKLFLQDNENPRGDFERDVLQRIIGGYSMQLPNDRMRAGDWPLATLDITSGAVHALCECWRQRTMIGADSIKVNLLFDFQSDQIELKSHLPAAGRLRLHAKTDKAVFVRIPPWVDRQTVRLYTNAEKQDVEIENGYLRITALKRGQSATITFGVPAKKETEIVDGVNYETRWIGNQIIEILPRGKVSPLPF